MAGNYEKNMYKQLVEVMERLDILESENKALKKEIKYLRAENNRLQFEVDKLKEENKYLRVENARLAAENESLKEDNERMKRSLSNNSENSSIPPSQDKCGKPVNTYNSRKTTGKKVGAQLGHKGKNISKNDVKEKNKKRYI